jgi:hypothetical protein
LFIAPTIEEGALDYGPVSFKPGPDHSVASESAKAVAVAGVGVEEDAVVAEFGGDEHPLHSGDGIEDGNITTGCWIDEVGFNPVMSHSPRISRGSDTLGGDIEG